MTTEEKIKRMLADYMQAKCTNDTPVIRNYYSLAELSKWHRIAFLQMIEREFNISFNGDPAKRTDTISGLAQAVDRLKNPPRSFTQADLMKGPDKCDGCYQQCKLDAMKFEFDGPYYPIIGGQLVKSYTDKNGQKRVITAKESGDPKTALGLTHLISTLCKYYEKQR